MVKVRILKKNETWKKEMYIENYITQRERERDPTFICSLQKVNQVSKKWVVVKPDRLVCQSTYNAIVIFLHLLVPHSGIIQIRVHFSTASSK